MQSRTFFLFLLLAFLPIACEDDSVHPDALPPALAWSRVDGGVGEGRFTAVWGASADSLFALGTEHRMLKALHGAWSEQPLAPTVAGLRALWGRTSNDVFAAGENGLILHFDGTAWAVLQNPLRLRLNDVWGGAAPLVFAAATDPVSGAGRVLQYDGAAWSALPGRFDTGLNAVWAVDATTIFVAGESGYAARFDNRGWTSLLPFVSDFAWLDAWGSGSTDVFFAGEGGRIGHFHAGSLAITTTVASGALRSVSGRAADDVWAVGDAGSIVHFDGTVWSLAPSGTTSSLRALHVFSDGRAVALGDYGTVLLLENGIWRVVNDGRFVEWKDIFCFSKNETFLAGREGVADGIVRHIDGREWLFPGEEALGLFGFAPDDVYLVGRGGTIRHFDGAAWTNETSGTMETLSSIAGTLNGSDRQLVAVGDRGTIRTWTGTRWGPMLTPGGNIQPLYDVWAAAPDDVFAVGATTSVFRFRGPVGSLQWSAESTGLTGSWFEAIAGRGPFDVVAVSHDGRFFRYNGVAWHEMTGGNGAPLADVALDGRHDGFALARPHTLFLLGNGRWNAAEIPHLGELLSVGAAGDVGFVAGRYGTILKFRP